MSSISFTLRNNDLSKLRMDYTEKGIESIPGYYDKAFERICIFHSDNDTNFTYQSD